MASVISGDANVSAAEFGFLDGVTSAIQTQLGSKLDIAGGKILQVVSTTKTDTYQLTSQTFTEITGLTATITPSSATSKVLVQAVVQINFNPSLTRAGLRLMRGATAIGIGAAASNRTPASGAGTAGANSHMDSVVMHHLDSPATTSATTYSVQIRSSDASQTVSVNRSDNDTDNNTHFRVVSTITVMEVSA